MHYKRIYALSKKNFELVKTLKQNDVDNRIIANIIGCSPNSIYTWEKYDTWEDFCEFKKTLVKQKFDERQVKESNREPLNLSTLSRGLVPGLLDSINNPVDNPNVTIPKKDFNELCHYIELVTKILVNNMA